MEQLSSKHEGINLYLQLSRNLRMFFFTFAGALYRPPWCFPTQLTKKIVMIIIRLNDRVLVWRNGNSLVAQDPHNFYIQYVMIIIIIVQITIQFIYG